MLTYRASKYTFNLYAVNAIRLENFENDVKKYFYKEIKTAKFLNN